MKVLLLGAGRWGANHLRVLSSLPVELFVSDLDPGRLRSAQKLGIDPSRLSSNYKDFCPRVDAAVIVTPAPSHFALCLEMLEAGKDVFVEKPLALTAEQCRQLAGLAQRNGRILQVGHIFRFDTASQWLRQAARAGKFGPIHMLRGHFGGFKRPRNDSGVMFADGIHFIDLFNYILDARPKSVLAIHHDFLKRGMEDVSFVSLEYETAAGNTWATVDNDYFIPGKYRRVVVAGEKLSAICDYNAAQPVKILLSENRHVREGADFEAIAGAATPIECAPEEPLQAELGAFVHSVQTRQKPLADGWTGYEAAIVLDGASQSVKTGQQVTLQYE
jgi:UDP-N-acetylglucosamine 3-dehydrogenase